MKFLQTIARTKLYNSALAQQYQTAVRADWQQTSASSLRSSVPLVSIAH